MREAVEGDEQLHKLRPIDPLVGADAVHVAVRLDVQERNAAAIPELFLERWKSLDELVARGDAPESDRYRRLRCAAERLDLAEKLLAGLPVSGPQPFHDVDGAESEPIVHTDRR